MHHHTHTREGRGGGEGIVFAQELLVLPASTWEHVGEAGKRRCRRPCQSSTAASETGQKGTEGKEGKRREGRLGEYPFGSIAQRLVFLQTTDDDVETAGGASLDATGLSSR